MYTITIAVPWHTTKQVMTFKSKADADAYMRGLEYNNPGAAKYAKMEKKAG